jgi:hypothetical protein
MSSTCGGQDKALADAVQYRDKIISDWINNYINQDVIHPSPTSIPEILAVFPCIIFCKFRLKLLGKLWTTGLFYCGAPPPIYIYIYIGGIGTLRRDYIVPVSNSYAITLLRYRR